MFKSVPTQNTTLKTTKNTSNSSKSNHPPSVFISVSQTLGKQNETTNKGNHQYKFIDFSISKTLPIMDGFDNQVNKSGTGNTQPERTPCPQCSKTILTRFYDDHDKDVHKGRTFLCDSFFAPVRSLGPWKNHNLTRHGSQSSYTVYFEDVTQRQNFSKVNRNTCEVCHKDFQDSTIKQHHYDEEHRMRQFHCDSCPEVMKS